MEREERAIPNHPHLQPIPKGNANGSRRRSGRLPLEALQSNLGPVLDISAGGMRVLTRGKPRNGTQIILHGFPLPGQLVANVSWVKRAGLFMREVGMCFENVSPEMSAALTNIASMHRYRRAM